MRPVDRGWFGGVADSLDGLATEIRQERGREPDPGDLLIVLASTPDTVVSDLISELDLTPIASPKHSKECGGHAMSIAATRRSRRSGERRKRRRNLAIQHLPIAYATRSDA